MKPSRDIAGLIEIMAALRTPGTGCPWDLEQTFESIAPYTIEEAYEVADAIARGDLADLREELGDLLLQVVFHARMAQEQGAFEFGDVIEAITTKLLRRHPHVFGDAQGSTAKAVEGLWERIKAQEKAERAARGAGGARAGARRGSPRPARPYPRAQTAGKGVQGGVRLERSRRRCCKKSARRPDEIETAIATGSAKEAAAEIGDLLFAVVNLARHLEADPEALLRATNQKFERRFAAIERALAQRGKAPQDATLSEMDALWDAAKAAERDG